MLMHFVNTISALSDVMEMTKRVHKIKRLKRDQKVITTFTYKYVDEHE